MMVAPKEHLRDPWQYTGQPPQEWPEWVKACCNPRFGDKSLVLYRRSGKQDVHLTEWLLRNLDERDPEWLTDAEYRRDYGGVG